jgi:uncharacterized membrane protein
MYLFVKLLHVAATVLFIGNIVTGVYWKLRADRAGDGNLIASTLDTIARSERLITLPSAAVLLLTGIGLARLAGLSLLGTPWLAASIGLFAMSGLVFGLIVTPLQRRLRAAALEVGRAEYQRLSFWWEVSGWTSIVSSVAALVLMVLKPWT